VITQTWALLVDSVRLLRSRYLFWIALTISAFAAFTLFGSYSFNAEGIRILWFKTIEVPRLAAGTPGSRSFIAALFAMYVRFWLGWGAIILALLATSGILPEFVTGGAIELNLARPIARWRLFMTKVLSTLLFVLVQVTVGVGLAWLLAGARFGIWDHPMLWAIPLITLQFLYLYSFSALLAVVTRSTLACLIGTILFWFVVFLVQFSSNTIDQQLASQESLLASSKQRIAAVEKRLADEHREPNARERRNLDRWHGAIDDVQPIIDGVRPWAQTMHRVELFVPKTGDVQKIVANLANAPVQNEFAELFGVDVNRFRPQSMPEDQWEDSMTADTAGEHAVRAVDAAVSIGTSCAATLVLFGAATFVFTRRDF